MNKGSNRQPSEEKEWIKTFSMPRQTGDPHAHTCARTRWTRLTPALTLHRRRHPLPSLLRFLDVFLGCFYLFIRSHFIYLHYNLCNLHILFDSKWGSTFGITPGDSQDVLVAHEPPLWKRGTNVGCNPLLAAIFQCGISCGLSDHTDMQLRQH